MPVAIKLFLAAACVFRFATLVISVRHERKLKAAGAKEYGRANSLVLGALHSMIYVGALVEGFRRNSPVDGVTRLGVLLYLVGAAGLVMVMLLLGRLWTLKVLIASDHVLVRHPIFRALKHPNYFLGVLPELVGFLLILHAWVTMAVGMPVYLVSLWLRIREEERVMGQEFAGY